MTVQSDGDGAAGAVPNRARHPSAARRVLLVDDDEDYAHFVKRLLARMGIDHPLDIVHDEKSALQALDARPYDVVVSDFELRPGSGLRVLEHVQRRHPGAQRILLTNTPETAQKHLPHGGRLAHGVWDKRWELGTIRDQLRTLLHPTP